MTVVFSSILFRKNYSVYSFLQPSKVDVGAAFQVMKYCTSILIKHVRTSRALLASNACEDVLSLVYYGFRYTVLT